MYILWGFLLPAPIVCSAFKLWHDVMLTIIIIPLVNIHNLRIILSSNFIKTTICILDEPYGKKRLYTEQQFQNEEFFSLLFPQS